MANRLSTWGKALSLATTLSLSLSSCNMYKLEELRHTAPSGTPFQNALSHLYMDYATTAEQDYDWPNSWHFADKGLMLAYGKDMPPEDLNDWDIPPEHVPELEHARAELMSVLTPDNEEVRPQRTAEAQFYFDCWVKEQEQNWREDEIANCRDNFIRASGDLMGEHYEHSHASELLPVKKKKVHHSESAMPTPIAEDEKPAEKHVSKATEPAAAPESAPEAATEPAKPKKKHKGKTAESKEEKSAESKDAGETLPESTSYAVFFEPDQAEVSEPGMNVITEVIKSLRDVPDYLIVLHPSKDHPGKAAERIQVIKTLLTAGGIKESAIHVASGKTEVETGKSASTRHVEIFLNE